MERLERVVAERDLQLREVEHRAKNSLQLASAMLLLQRRLVPDKAARAGLEEAARKLSVLADLHRRMYDGGHGQGVALRGWLVQICDGFSLRPDLKVILSCTDAVWPFERVLPLGLFVAEALTNAMKHGGGGPVGLVAVDLHPVPKTPELWRLSVRDDGSGPPDEVRPGLGLRVLAALALQLGGSLQNGSGLDGRGFGAGVVFPAASTRPALTREEA